MSDLNDVLKKVSYETPIGYEDVDWFVDEVMILENKIFFYFKNSKRNFTLTEEDKEHYKIKKNCRFH